MPPFLDPRRNHLRVGPGVTAQLCSLSCQRSTELSLARALEDPGDLGKQVSTASGELAQLVHLGRVLSLGQITPPGVTPRLPRELSDEDPVSSTPAPISPSRASG
jgi:hypothetical protein